MRESNYTYPPQNRAVLTITHLLYDRRALDTTSPIALLNNLISLTHLTSTAPRIREILTCDGGLERLIDIIRSSTLPRPTPRMHDLWGLNGPSTARVLPHDKQVQLRYCLAFQSVVNLGVRGNEAVRTRVVQAGVLDITAEILEHWLKDQGISIHPGPLGSQAAVDAVAKGDIPPGVGEWGRRHKYFSMIRRDQIEGNEEQNVSTQNFNLGTYGQSRQNNSTELSPLGLIPIFPRETLNDLRTRLEAPLSVRTGLGTGEAALLTRGGLIARERDPRDVRDRDRERGERTREREVRDRQRERRQVETVDTDVDMADTEDAGTDAASVGADDSMDIDDEGTIHPPLSAISQTPRASQHLLPLPLTIAPPSRSVIPEAEEQPSTSASSAADSMSGDDGPIPRATSDSNLARTAIEASQSLRTPALSIGIPGRTLPPLGRETMSNRSSPVGTPRRTETADSRIRGRRGTIVARPIGLMPRNDLRDGGGSGTSDGGEEIDLPTATVAQGLITAQAQQRQGRATVIPGDDDPEESPANVEIADTARTIPDDSDIEAMAAEEARLDLEAGAPPGQPGATETPRTVPEADPTPRQTTTEVPVEAVADEVQEQAQIIIANGAPRGFQDLNAYVGLSSLLNPDTDRYSDDAVLLALQLLAYLSKYPHVRDTFHHPRKPMHPTFDLFSDQMPSPLPERPALSVSANIFSLAQRFTFKPGPADPDMFRIPVEIQYWAGVIMRNACRKDEANGGTRQCARMDCGKKETVAREFSKCRKCRKAKYCSKECQSMAWAEGHRFWCSARDEGPPRPPSETSANPTTEVEGGSEFVGLGVTRDVLMRAIATARAMRARALHTAPVGTPDPAPNQDTAPVVSASPTPSPGLAGPATLPHPQSQPQLRTETQAQSSLATRSQAPAPIQAPTPMPSAASLSSITTRPTSLTPAQISTPALTTSTTPVTPQTIIPPLNAPPTPSTSRPDRGRWGPIETQLPSANPTLPPSTETQAINTNQPSVPPQTAEPVPRRTAMGMLRRASDNNQPSTPIPQGQSATRSRFARFFGGERQTEQRGPSPLRNDSTGSSQTEEQTTGSRLSIWRGGRLSPSGNTGSVLGSSVGSSEGSGSGM
ncbi:hypothetical protein M231_00423 [Tremella mesenterica]|uniref:MYND-type domain-containing protein n=1 Tax=Tremella mesenterica TaxID=5217 RepID=A0A4Q1BW92_TREME|nr:hypothetical protein M231_00423 [Tremella mesenterica]